MVRQRPLQLLLNTSPRARPRRPPRVPSSHAGRSVLWPKSFHETRSLLHPGGEKVVHHRRQIIQARDIALGKHRYTEHGVRHVARCRYIPLLP